MQDVCWIHNKYYHFGEQCPDCREREVAYKRSLIEDVPKSNVKKREPGDRMWGIAKMLFIFNVIFWLAMILGAVIITGAK